MNQTSRNISDFSAAHKIFEVAQVSVEYLILEALCGCEFQPGTILMKKKMFVTETKSDSRNVVSLESDVEKVQVQGM